jgi:hypothetical protein
MPSRDCIQSKKTSSVIEHIVQFEGVAGERSTGVLPKSGSIGHSSDHHGDWPTIEPLTGHQLAERVERQ